MADAYDSMEVGEWALLPSPKLVQILLADAIYHSKKYESSTSSRNGPLIDVRLVADPCARILTT